MGWSFSEVQTSFEFQGQPTDVVADGNNVAWLCPYPNCHQPVLFVYRRGRNGSSAADFFHCRCGRMYYLEPEFGDSPEPPRRVSRSPDNPMQIRQI